MSFDASLLVIMAIFWVTYVILRVCFFKPMVALLEEREGRVSTAQQTWEQAFAETQKRLDEERALAGRDPPPGDERARRAPPRGAGAAGSQTLAEVKKTVQAELGRGERRDRPPGARRARRRSRSASAASPTTSSTACWEPPLEAAPRPSPRAPPGSPARPSPPRSPCPRWRARSGEADYLPRPAALDLAVGQPAPLPRHPRLLHRARRPPVPRAAAPRRSRATSSGRAPSRTRRAA